MIYNLLNNMKTLDKQIYVQLKDTSQLTGACWAVWIERTTKWEVLSSFELNAQNLLIVMELLQTAPVHRWLIGKLTGHKQLPRSILQNLGLAGERIYVFPDQMTQRVILVGSNKLNQVAQRFWQGVALGNSTQSILNPESPAVSFPDLGIPYYLPEVLDRVLEMVLKTADSEIGWLAIRSGDFFEVRAFQKCKSLTGEEIPIESNPLLREIIKTHEAKLVQKEDVEWAMVPRNCDLGTARIWVGLPLLIGQRLIGLVAFWCPFLIQQETWNDIRELAKRIAPSVEASVTFSDLTEHLGRMALLNDFAVTITSALDTEQIAQRLFALLRRAFGTDRINMVVLLPEGNGLQNFTDREGTIVLQTMSLEDASSTTLIGTGEVSRVDSSDLASNYNPVYPGSRSALIIPMKYRRQLIGVLGLESVKESAFTIYDEHLLMVMASQLAGLLENGRLRREAENRARNLSLIHEVIEQIIGLTDVREISQIAAELMARNFAYELAVIALIDGPEKDINVMGIGGNAADLVQQGLRYMDESRKDGIVMRVAITGENILVNDASQSPFYRPIPNWDAKSEMCVVLKDGDQIIGVVDIESQRKNAFSNNDMIMLKSLAGILSNVMSNAGQYQKLQATVDQLRTAREELQERIIAQRMAESRLVQAAKLAAVGEMAAGIAHELNNPLTTVSGFTELVLEEMPEGSTAREDLELVLRESQRASGVVRRLLDFARQSESARTRSDVNEIVGDVLALVNHLLRTSGVALTTELTENLPWVSVDRNQIKQVILNLIHNALHAMPTGGEIHLRTMHQRRDQRNWLTIILTDTGTGIAPENLDRVFEPFFTTRSKDGGTGLGLTVTYGIVTDHGGFINVESQVGVGSTFTVWLPIEAES